jgi:peptide/nickel transport system permease protein
MTIQDQAIPETAKKSSSSSAFTRVARYTVVRLLSLFVTVVIGIYLTILIANMGGYVDQIMKDDIHERITEMVAANPANRNLSIEVRKKKADALILIEEKRLGLDTPLAIRTVNYLSSALTLNLGRALNMTSDSGSKQVRLIILERLPATLLLFATAEMLLFFSSIFIALTLSRNYGSPIDKAIIAMTPSSAAPGWFYGIFLILIFAALFRVLPFGGLVDSPPPGNPVDYSLNLLKHLILPTTAITLSAIFISIYSWRTFFLIYSSEDYVDMAKAKGLTSRSIESRYILRPTLPSIITTFALTLISLWTGAPILETVFNWPGLGNTIYKAIGLYDTPVIVGSTVIFAYLLAITVFLLDFIYALVDPRVKIGGGESKL